MKHHLQSRLLSLCKDSGEIHNLAEYGLKMLKKDSTQKVIKTAFHFYILFCAHWSTFRREFQK